MTIKEALRKAINLLKIQNIEEPILKSKIILSNCISRPKEYLFIHENEELNQKIENDFFEKINRLCNNVPLQYITNIQQFMGLKFYVDEHVLIPRSDTEVLVETVINGIDKNKNVNILDMCTGSGIIAVTLVKMCSNIEMTAIDKSESALSVARRNAKFNNVEGKIKFIKSDMFENLVKKYDMIVSNPPYIETDVIETLSKDVQNEPKMALDGGEDGLKFYRIIAENLEKFLKKGGYLFLEIGYNQRESVSKIIEDKFENVKCIKDFAGKDRVIVGEIYKKD